MLLHLFGINFGTDFYYGRIQAYKLGEEKEERGENIR